MNVNFYLRRRDRDSPQRVFWRVSIGGRYVKRYTDVHVRPLHWNLSRQRVKHSVAGAGVDNAHLDQTEHFLKDLLLRMRYEGIAISAGNFARKYDLESTPDDNQDQEFAVLEVYDRWLSEFGPHNRSEGTLQVYKSSRRHLADYEKLQGDELQFSDQASSFVHRFWKFLLEEKRLVNSSVWKVFKTWKTFSRWAVEQGYSSEKYFQRVTRKQFHVIEENKVRLTKAELRQIRDLQLPSGSMLETVRDQFLVQCATGLRFGDLVRLMLAPDKYISECRIRMVTQKNRKSIEIPITSEMEQLIFRLAIS